MLVTPIWNNIKTFNANKEYIFTFNVMSGNQVVGNNLVIERLDDNVVVYDGIQDTFNFRHILPAGTLENGKSYRAKVRTKDINNNWSNFSNWFIFWCFSEPVLTITTIDYQNQNRVYNQTILFETTYAQAEGEPLQSYRYLLYDENKILLKAFPERFADGSEPLTEEITVTEANKLYHLEVQTISPNGNIGTTGLVPFTAAFVAPRLTAAIIAENVPEQGAIRLSASIIQIRLKLYDNNGNLIDYEDIEYVDNDWIDMNREDYGYLIADEGFDITDNNFILQLWCKNLPENKVFLTLYSPQGKIEMFKLKNRIRVYKYVNNLNIKGYFVSNEFEANENQNIMIYMKQENHLIDLFVEAL